MPGNAKAAAQHSTTEEIEALAADLGQFGDKKYRAEARRIVARYEPLVEPLALAFGPDSEVVLHDFSRLPHSVVAISGTLSGRQIGGLPTDLALKNISAANPEPYHIGYETVMPNGRVCRSSSIHLFGSSPRPAGSLCINTDVSALKAARDAIDALMGLGERRRPVEPAAHPVETFHHSVDSLADTIISDAISTVGVPLEMMSKKQKVEVVRVLKDRGFFLLRDGIDLAASALDVSRFTIYKYLNDLNA
jgi:predicted transcriptional regulator YheO